MLTVIAICLGACVGALSRWQLGLWLNPAAAAAGTTLPLGTLAANLIGGFVLLVLAASVFFYPVWVGQWISYEHCHWRMWLPSWI